MPPLLTVCLPPALEGTEVVVHGATGRSDKKGKGRLRHEGEGEAQGQKTRAQLSEG